MQKHINDYKGKLEKEICDYMSVPICERSVAMITQMLHCIEDLSNYKYSSASAELTATDMEHWNKIMENVDGTQGGHWTVEQTTSVAKSNGVEFSHITPEMWNVTMNMMYSDYYSVALKHGVNTAEFFADMSKAFLFDKDGGSPKEKLSAYYHNIVDRETEK